MSSNRIWTRYKPKPRRSWPLQKIKTGCKLDEPARSVIL
jgi:hypothetical protein